MLTKTVSLRLKRALTRAFEELTRSAMVQMEKKFF